MPAIAQSVLTYNPQFTRSRLRGLPWLPFFLDEPADIAILMHGFAVLIGV
jgi:hypothetical protein